MGVSDKGDIKKCAVLGTMVGKLCHRRTIFVKKITIQYFLTFYNLKKLLSPQRTICETERLFGC